MLKENSPVNKEALIILIELLDITSIFVSDEYKNHPRLGEVSVILKFIIDPSIIPAVAPVNWQLATQENILLLQALTPVGKSTLAFMKFTSGGLGHDG